MNTLEIAKEVFEKEAQAILDLATNLDENFNQAVNLMLNTKGRCIVSGMGKSGHIGAKIAATLASTGTPSFFIHPGEALHGDLGMLTSEDVLIAISNSGETEEILKIIPAIKKREIPLIVMCGKKKFYPCKARRYIFKYSRGKGSLSFAACSYVFDNSNFSYGGCFSGCFDEGKKFQA